MTTSVQRRRGTTAQHSTFTGLEGEVTIDTTKDTAVIHDGATAGGFPLAKENLANTNPSTLTALTGSGSAADDLFVVYDASTSSMKKITREELNNALEQDALSNVTITGGSINGTTVGASTASTGAFTTLTSSSTTTLNGTTIPASKTLLVSTDIGSTVQAYDADLAAFALKTAPTGAVVGTSDTQTLTGKTISADSNTLSGIAASSFVLSNASGNLDGSAAQKVIPAGVVVGTTDTQTLTNKTIDGTSNTLTNLSYANITEPVRHSIRPSLLLDFANTEQLDPRITFSRPTTARYYDGKTVVKAEENLLLQSQTFDNASWFKLSMSVTANSTVAPDGTTTADTITTTAGAGTDYLGQNPTIVSGLPYVASIYAKYSNAQWLRFRVVSAVTGNPSAWFDVQNGVIGTVESGITASITSVGNGWYRCTIAFTSISSSSDYRFYPSSADGGASQSIGLASILWGAQLEQRSSVTAYTATTTAPITNYIPVLLTQQSNEARFDHNPTTGESLGLLIEEQRTNLLTYSEQFDNAAWTKSNSSVSSNTVVSPDGTLTGDLLIASATAAAHAIYGTSVSITSGTSYSASVYVKSAGASYVSLRGQNAVSPANYPWITVDLTTGSIAANGAVASSSATNVGNGWWRIVLSWVANATVTSTSNIVIGTSNVSTAPSGTSALGNSYTGDGYSGIYIWGAQLEAGAFATSYIPTVASQVTRSADSASMTGANFSSWYRADEGTLYANAITLNSNTTPTDIRAFEFTDNTTNNRLLISRSNGGVSSILIQSGAATQANMSSAAWSANTNGKIVLGYKVNDFAMSFNGAAAVTDTLGSVPPALTQMTIGNQFLAGAGWNSTISKIAYYPRRLTNAELVSLTTI